MANLSNLIFFFAQAECGPHAMTQELAPHRSLLRDVAESPGLLAQEPVLLPNFHQNFC